MELPVWALGLMSGTSMDGVDAAAILTDGEEIQGFGTKRFDSFTPELREMIRDALGKWPGEPGVDAVSHAVTEAHGESLTYFPTVEVVGFHGQTLAHDPAGRGTHQVGDGRVLSQIGRKTVVWDFRTADVASGGQGAPLIPYFHHACARTVGLSDPVAFLNIGGVANVTWVDPTFDRPEAPGALRAFDTGPGNAIMDDLMRVAGAGAYDDGGARAGNRYR